MEELNHFLSTIYTMYMYMYIHYYTVYIMYSRYMHVMQVTPYIHVHVYSSCSCCTCIVHLSAQRIVTPYIVIGRQFLYINTCVYTCVLTVYACCMSGQVHVYTVPGMTNVQHSQLSIITATHNIKL